MRVYNGCVHAHNHVCEYMHEGELIHEWRSENNVRCQSLPSSVLETGFCYVFTVYTRIAVPGPSRNSVSTSHLPLGVLP